MTLWGGRFQGKADPLFRQFNDSLPVDWRLVQQDIAGSIAWASALCAAGVLSGEEAGTINRALEELAAEAKDNPGAVVQSGEEDVHSWVESRLIAKIGSLGKKLQTGRSRNDQVATDLRLWVREEIGTRLAEIREVQRALVQLGQRESETVFPGYTHLQQAQPVRAAHWMLSHFWPLERDRARLADAARRPNVLPHGAPAHPAGAYPL